MATTPSAGDWPKLCSHQLRDRWCSDVHSLFLVVRILAEMSIGARPTLLPPNTEPQDVTPSHSETDEDARL